MASRRTAALAATVTASGLLATGLSGVVTVSAASAAADATPGYSLRHITVHTSVGPHGHVPCKVDADLYVPDGASSTHRKPSILTTNGFGGSKDDSNESAVGKGFVRAGYVVLAYTGLGFPHSGCKIRLDDPDYDGKAGKQLVSVLAGSRSYTTEGGVRKKLHLVSRESKGDPRVGMIGGSYGGQIQYAVAEQDKRVDALIPIITWNDLSYSLAPNNTSLHGVTYGTPGVAKKEWVDLFSSVGFMDGATGLPDDPNRGDPPCFNFADAACAGVARLNTIGYPDASTLELARHASVSTYAKKVTAPTLIVQGQQDTLFNLQESAATYRSLRAQGTPTRLVWQSWGHSHSQPAPGELDFNAKSLRDSYLGNRFLNWMNHYVRGHRSAPVGARFAYFRDWVNYDTRTAYAGKAIRKAYATRGSFSQKLTEPLYFSGSNALRPTLGGVHAGTSAFVATPGPTSYSETSGVEDSSPTDNPPTDSPGTFAAFTTLPLTHAVRLVGSSKLTVHLTAPVAEQSQSTDPAGKLVLFAKIYDIAPDGTKTLHDRLISPVRITDVTKPVHITLPGVVQRFPAGHKISVVLAGGDAAYAGNVTNQPVTISTSQSAPSVIRMPLRDEPRFH